VHLVGFTTEISKFLVGAEGKETGDEVRQA
jgi:hypothetical protein